MTRSLSFILLMVFVNLTLASTIVVKDASGIPIAEFKPGGFIYTYQDERAIKRKIGSSGKVKYKDAQGNTLAKINQNNDGFKLKNHDGYTLWKVKYKDYGLKIGHGDEMLGAYKLKSKKRGQFTLQQQGADVATVTYKGNIISISHDGNQLLSLSAGGLQFAGVLAIEDAALVDRLIILSELMSH